MLLSPRRAIACPRCGRGDGLRFRYEEGFASGHCLMRCFTCQGAPDDWQEWTAPRRGPRQDDRGAEAVDRRRDEPAQLVSSAKG